MLLDQTHFTYYIITLRRSYMEGFHFENGLDSTDVTTDVADVAEC